VRIYPGEDGYFVAYCRELPGCVSQGKTFTEARENIREAMALYLETLSELAMRPRGKAPLEGERKPVRVAKFSLEPMSA
jgi:predicted RNase H-like HicB family nuclease